MYILLIHGNKLKINPPHNTSTRRTLTSQTHDPGISSWSYWNYDDDDDEDDDVQRTRHFSDHTPITRRGVCIRLHTFTSPPTYGRGKVRRVGGEWGTRRYRLVSGRSVCGAVAPPRDWRTHWPAGWLAGGLAGPLSDR